MFGAMSSFLISYGLKTHKVSCPPSSTVSKLIELSRPKFKLAPDAAVDLVFKDKVIDSLLPLRYANVPVNAKLVLKNTEPTKLKEITVKLALAEGGSYVTRIDTQSTLAQMLAQIESTHGAKLWGEDGSGSTTLVLTAMNTSVNEPEFASTKVVALVGNQATSAVIRLSRVTTLGGASARKDEQERIVKLQLERQKARNLRLREEAAKQAEMEAVPKDEQEEHPQQHDGAALTEDKPSAHLDCKSVTSEKPVQPQAPITDVEPATPLAPAQVYLPSTQSSESYAHTAETYDMTVAQAQKYHKMLVDSMKPKKPRNIPPKIPNRYIIRVKFPDRCTLQLVFEDGATVKFGSLLKKLDELLLPQFRNHYTLKFGYPPFTKITANFRNNDTALHELKVSKNPEDVFTERTSLIWELDAGNDNRGPFLMQEGTDIAVAPNSERPEIQLESHRGELPDDKPDNGRNQSKKPGVPKWFKLAK